MHLPLLQEEQQQMEHDRPENTLAKGLHGGVTSSLGPFGRSGDSTSSTTIMLPSTMHHGCQPLHSGSPFAPSMLLSIVPTLPHPAAAHHKSHYHESQSGGEKRQLRERGEVRDPYGRTPTTLYMQLFSLKK
nr:unnamed protein product [Leishmania braziliensis]CAJ2479769.1 unnamed protein product [Leishmania braziliensis]